MNVGFSHGAVLVSFAIGFAGFPSASAAEGVCKHRTVPVYIQVRKNSDVYRALQLRGDEALTVFKTPRTMDLLRGRRIVDEEPTLGLARLTDGSGIAFDRDCRGSACVYLGLKTVSHATACWTSLSWADSVRNRNGFGAFVLSPHQEIALENRAKGGRLVLRTRDKKGRVTTEPLLIASRPIVGFGVSVPLGGRTIDVIRREADGSLSLASYGYFERPGGAEPVGSSRVPAIPF